MENTVELGVIGGDLVATFFEDEQEETRRAMTIDQIITQLRNISLELDSANQGLFLHDVVPNVLSALEAEYINCFAEPK